MPEIIDLEVARKNMYKRVKNRKIVNISTNKPQILKNCSEADLKEKFVNKNIQSIDRKGKILIFNVDDAKLVCHLMLTGDFVWSNDLGDRTSVFSMEFENDIGIEIIDPKSWIILELHSEGFESKLLSKDIGINPLSEEFTKFTFLEILQRKKRSRIKSVFLDQKNISGLGNAYSDEILWEAGIHPKTKIGDILEKNLVGVLFDSIKKVLVESLETVESLSKGISISEQERDFMNIYRKENKNCPKCGDVINKTKVSGRDTFFCPTCQKEEN